MPDRGVYLVSMYDRGFFFIALNFYFFVSHAHACVINDVFCNAKSLADNCAGDVTASADVRPCLTKVQCPCTVFESHGSLPCSCHMK